MIPDTLFDTLIAAAGRAPSADNMQAWVFTPSGDTVEARLEPSRVLPTDVNAMFALVGLGAAIENLVIAAEHEGYSSTVDYDALSDGSDRPGTAPVVVRLCPIGSDDPLAAAIGRRETNRGGFATEPLGTETLNALAESTGSLRAGVHWATGRDSLDQLARLDAGSTYIRLEHRPLHDELFGILRFTRRDSETAGFGLEFEALGVPGVLVWMGRLMRYPSVTSVVSRLGIGRLVARRLADRLRTSAAVCLVTALDSGPAGYVEAGRAMERLWLAATLRGLAVQPHGVMPQYLTKVAVEPETFGRYAARIQAQQELFDSVFPRARAEHPAMVLRIGRPLTVPARRSVRLPNSMIVRR